MFQKGGHRPRLRGARAFLPVFCVTAISQKSIHLSPVPEMTLLFALLWRSRIVRHAHAASRGPSDTAEEHDTPTPVVMRPRGRALPSESGVREHTHPILVVRVENHEHEQKAKNAKMTINAALMGRKRLH